MMHTLMSFLGCIGTLMKASGVDILNSAAFAGITSVVNGKAWTNALWAYRLIIAVLLQNFYSNSANTYEELTVYWRHPESTRPGHCGWTALSNLHCYRSCSCLGINIQDNLCWGFHITPSPIKHTQKVGFRRKT